MARITLTDENEVEFVIETTTMDHSQGVDALGVEWVKTIPGPQESEDSTQDEWEDPYGNIATSSQHD